MIFGTLIITSLYLKYVSSTSLCACATSDTKVYVEPNSDSRNINTMMTNECITILNEHNGWIKVKVLDDVGVGFVLSKTTIKRTCNNTFLGKEIRSTHLDSWKDWVQWSPCGVTCGGGTRFRFRICGNVYNNDCPGDNFQKENCSTQHCPINGEWASWGGYSKCVGQCGLQGIQTVTRTCTNPAPQFNGTYCQGESSKYLPCFPHCSTTTAKPTTTTQQTTTVSTPDPVQTLKTCDKLGLLHALGNKLKIQHSLASACPDNTFTSPDALVIEYCPMGRASTWTKSINVVEGCNNDILHSQYLPIASYHFSGLTSYSGIFLGCIPGGFKIAMQLCGQTPEIYHILNATNLANVLNPYSYYIVTS